MKSLVLALSLLILQQQQTGATIEGQVLRAGTLQPLAESRILLTKVGGKLTDSILATSDALGRFSVANIPPGSYRVFADHDDYVRAEYGQRTLAQPGASIALAAGQRVADLNLVLTPTSVVTGRITSREGVPIPRVYIRAYKSAYAQGERKLSVVKETQSNDLGEYRLFGLTPGLYFISAAPYAPPQVRDGMYIVPTPPTLDGRGEGYSQFSVAPRLSSGAPIHPLALTGESYAQIYYPGTTDARSARPVEIQPGTVVRAVDFNTMRIPRSGYHVRGQFIDSRTGQNATGVRWTIGEPGLLATVRDGEAPQGTFEATDLQPGRYTLSGVVSGGGLDFTVAGNLLIEVSTTSLDNLRIVLNPPINLSGQVTNMNAALSGATVTLQPPSGGRHRSAPMDLFPSRTCGPETTNSP
jgi:hypothetical protein